MQWLGDDLISPFERDAPSFQQSVLQSLARIEESAPTLTSQLRAVQESLKGATIGYGIALAISDEVRLNRQAVDILSVVAKGHRPAVLALAELAAHYECDIAQNAADGLRQIGLPDISQVINELGAALDAHGDIWPLYECLKQLGEAGARIVAEHVMSDPGHDFAVRALGEMGRVAHGVQEKVAALLDDHRVLPFLQSGLIIDTLMRIEADAVVVVPRLIKLLPLADYRLSATLALPHWGTDAGGAGDALLDNLVAADNELHEATVKALESVRPLRPSTESRLQDLMSSSNPNVASAAGRLLGQQ